MVTYGGMAKQPVTAPVVSLTSALDDLCSHVPIMCCTLQSSKCDAVCRVR